MEKKENKNGGRYGRERLQHREKKDYENFVIFFPLFLSLINNKSGGT